MSNQFNSDIELYTDLDDAPCIYDVINEEYPTREYDVYHGFSPAEISSENIMNVPLSPIRVDWVETPAEIAEVNEQMKDTPLLGVARKRFRMMGKVPRTTAAKKVRFAPTANKEPRYPIEKKEIKVKNEDDKGCFYVGKKTKISLGEVIKLGLKPARYHNGEQVKDAGDFTLFRGRDNWFYARRGDNETYRLPYHKGQASYVFSWRGGVERASKIKGWEKPKVNY